MKNTNAATKQLPGWGKLLVWVVSLLAILGVAGLAGMGSGTTQGALAAPTSQSQLFAQDSQPADTQFCPSTRDQDDAFDKLRGTALPAMRWTNIELSSISDTDASAIGAGFTSMMTGIVNVMMSFAGLLWKAFFSVLSWGLMFQPLCTAAPQVNSLASMMGTYATVLLFPAILFTFWRQRQNIFRAGGTRVVGAILSVLFLFGTVFYVLDATNKVRDADATTIINTKGTLPWAASKLITMVSGLSTSLSYVSEYATEALPGGSTTAFFDSESAMQNSSTSESAFTCAKYDAALYKKYQETTDSQAGVVKGAAIAMEQMSRIWEVTYLSSYINAQYGAAADNSTIPYNLSCWRLERMNGAGETLNERADLFTNTFAGTPGMPTDSATLAKSGFAYLLYPGMGDYHSQLADAFWAICGNFKDGKLSLGKGLEGTNIAADAHCSREEDPGAPFGANGLTKTPEDADTDPRDLMKSILEAGRKEENCYFCFDIGIGKIKIGKIDGEDGLYTFDRGRKSIENKFAQAEDDKPVNADAIAPYRDWAEAWTGNSVSTRIMNSILAVLVAVAYVWSMAPVALGLPIAGILLVVALPAVPLALALMAMGIELGKRVLKVTAMACFATFMFGLLITFLASVNAVLTSTAASVLKDNIGGFFGQIIMGIMPIAALLLVRKAAQAMKLGDLTKFGGGLGMASGMVAAAAGESRAFTNASRKAGGTSAAGAAAMGAMASRMANRRRNKGESDKPSMLDRAANSAMGRKIANSKIAQGTKGLTQGLNAVGREKMGNAAHRVKKVAGNAPAWMAKQANKVPAVRSFMNSALAHRMGESRALAVTGKVAGAAAIGALAGGPGALLAAGGVLGHQALTQKFGKGDDKVSLMERAEAFGANRAASLAMARRRWAGKEITNKDLENTPGTTILVEDIQTPKTVAKGASEVQIKQVQEALQTLERVASPQQKAQMRSDEASILVAASLGYMYGGTSPDKFNGDFNGIITEAEHQVVRNHMARNSGIPARNWDVSLSGLAAPLPIQTRPDGLPKLRNASLEAYGAPEAWVPTNISERRGDESSDERIARVNGYMVAQGWLDPHTNQRVDMLDMMGYDLDNHDDREAFTSIVNGDAQLPPAARRKVSTSMTSAAAAVAEAYTRSAMAFTELPRARQNDFVAAANELVISSEKSLETLPSEPIKIDMARHGDPYGGSISIPAGFAPTVATAPSEIRALTSHLRDMQSAFDMEPDKPITSAERDQAVTAARDIMAAATRTAAAVQSRMADADASEMVLKQASAVLGSTETGEPDHAAITALTKDLNENQEKFARDLANLEDKIEKTLALAEAAPSANLMGKLKELAEMGDKLAMMSTNSIGNRLDEAQDSLSEYQALIREQQERMEVDSREAARTGVGHTLPRN